MITTFRLPLALGVVSLALVAGHGIAQHARPALDEPAVASNDATQPKGKSSSGRNSAPQFNPYGPASGDLEKNTPGTPFPVPSTSAAGQHSGAIQIHYTIRRPVTHEFRGPDGKDVKVQRYVFETRSAEIDKDDDLKQLDLPPEGKRAAVLAVTAARHAGLLDNLKAAKTPEEKEEHSLALKENYTEHYAIETWWREQKLAELEARLKELRAQVTQRQESEEKYVAAAMTIAELWADGIGITPPTPSRLPSGEIPSALQPSAPLYHPSPSPVSPLPSVNLPNAFYDAPSPSNLPGPTSSDGHNAGFDPSQAFAPVPTPAKAPVSTSY